MNSPIEALEVDKAERLAAAPIVADAVEASSTRPARRPLPDHLPRESMIHPGPCACPSCGGTLRRIGEDVTETLDYVAGRFEVVRHVPRGVRVPSLRGRPVERPSVIGIDDWAFRRGQRYGTLVCDLERRRVIALLPDRESGTVETWLAAQPEITIVARDRGGGYGEATARTLPHAIQVADRWHLMENTGAAFLDAVRKSMAAIRIAMGATTLDPERLTCAEPLQYDGYLRRGATGEAILALSRQGMPIKTIARTTGHSRKLVRDVLRGLTGDVFRARQSSLDAHLPRLDAEWAAGRRNGAELWRRLRASGFTGRRRVVGDGRRAAGAASALRKDRRARCRRRASSPA